jgi:hypothetical protein
MSTHVHITKDSTHGPEVHPSEVDLLGLDQSFIACQLREVSLDIFEDHCRRGFVGTAIVGVAEPFGLSPHLRRVSRSETSGLCLVQFSILPGLEGGYVIGGIDILGCHGKRDCSFLDNFLSRSGAAVV